VEAASYASVTRKVVTKFIKRELICRYGLPSKITLIMLPIWTIKWWLNCVKDLKFNIIILVLIVQRWMEQSRLLIRISRKLYRKWWSRIKTGMRCFPLLCMGIAPRYIQQLGQHLFLWCTEWRQYYSSK